MPLYVPNKPQTLWTKALVQSHAQVALMVELYTVPFYISVATSIQDPQNSYVKLIRSVYMEEMLHMQLAANLCLALDIQPNFALLPYGHPIPFLKPEGDSFLNVKPSPLNEDSLHSMLEIEIPREFTQRQHQTPCFPYESIGEMYLALLTGIKEVGPENFSWNTANQQKYWMDEAFPSIISNQKEAEQAINTITEQGEGLDKPGVCSQYGDDPSQFPIPEPYRLNNESLDPQPLNMTSHYGRFLEIKKFAIDQNNGFPPTYSGNPPQTQKQKDVLHDLQVQFTLLLAQLNYRWSGEKMDIFPSMLGIANQARLCWENNVTPQWPATAPKITTEEVKG